MKWMMLFAVIFVMMSCGDEPKRPKDLIAGKKMQGLMWDMIQADRFASIYILRDSMRRDVTSETFQLYDKVFQLHNVTRDQFVSSYKYYLSRPDLGKEIFDSVAAIANRAKTEANKPAVAKP